jgi:hypothetical protein
MGKQKTHTRKQKQKTRQGGLCYLDNNCITAGTAELTELSSAVPAVMQQEKICMHTVIFNGGGGGGGDDDDDDNDDDDNSNNKRNHICNNKRNHTYLLNPKTLQNTLGFHFSVIFLCLGKWHSLIKDKQNRVNFYTF